MQYSFSWIVQHMVGMLSKLDPRNMFMIYSYNLELLPIAMQSWRSLITANAINHFYSRTFIDCVLLDVSLLIFTWNYLFVVLVQLLNSTLHIRNFHTTSLREVLIIRLPCEVFCIVALRNWVESRVAPSRTADVGAASHFQMF